MALCPPYSQSNDGYRALITIYRKIDTLPWYNLTSIGRQYLLEENNAYLGLGSGTHHEGSIVFQVPLEKDIKYELKWTPPRASNITISYE